MFVLTGRSGVRIAVRGHRSLSQNNQTNPAAQLTPYSVITGAVCGGVKRRRERRGGPIAHLHVGEAYRSPTCNPEVNNEWTYTSTPQTPS